MAAVPPSPTLPCKDCGFVNEPERVYCHNCGAKLDRSLLPKEEQIRREPPERARKRIMRMTNPGSSPVAYVLRTLAKTLLFAAVAAGGVLASRPPADLPPAKAELTTRLVSSELSSAFASPQVKTVTFSQAEINSFLSSGHSTSEGLVPGVKYVRSFVQLEPGQGRFTVERSAFGYSIYLATMYRPGASGGSGTAQNSGGSLGRLPVHPLLMGRVDSFLFRDVATALKTEREYLRKATSIKVEEKKLTLVTPGAAKS